MENTNTSLSPMASKGKRFVNYLLDIIAFMLLLFVVGIVYGMILVVTGNEDKVIEQGNMSGSILEDYIFTFIVILVYYTVMEYFFKGKTIGKMITGTRAVNIDRTHMDFGTTFKRSLCRLIPFEPLSFLGEGGWHDVFSKTMVVDERITQVQSDTV